VCKLLNTDSNLAYYSVSVLHKYFEIWQINQVLWKDYIYIYIYIHTYIYWGPVLAREIYVSKIITVSELYSIKYMNLPLNYYDGQHNNNFYLNNLILVSCDLILDLVSCELVYCYMCRPVMSKWRPAPHAARRPLFGSPQASTFPVWRPATHTLFIFYSDIVAHLYYFENKVLQLIFWWWIIFYWFHDTPSGGIATNRSLVNMIRLSMIWFLYRIVRNTILNSLTLSNI